MRLKCSLLLVLLAFCSNGFAQEEKGAYDEIAQKVEKKIREDDKVHVEQLKVVHRDGTVYLEGVANLFGSRYRSGEKAAKVDGVKTVDNQIAVKSEEVSDIEIQSALIDKIQKHIRPEPFDLVSVKVNHGFVTLFGHVRDTTLKDKAFEESIWIRGVRNVENKIELASIAAGDERLRAAIYRRLKREYPQYFAGRFPAFVILVQNGKVALVGSVNSEGDKLKIASTIRSFTGVLSVENHLTAQ